VTADIDAPRDVGCCSACGGLGRDMYGPCWDCRGTGCAHPPDDHMAIEIALAELEESLEETP
jgi:hypothetical protein